MKTRARPSDAANVSRALKPGEKLLWHDRPNPFAYALHLWGKLFLVIGLPFFVAGVVVIWQVSEGNNTVRVGGSRHDSKSGRPATDFEGYLFGAVFAAIGAAMGGVPVVRYIKGRRVVYAITSDRALRLRVSDYDAEVSEAWGDKQPLPYLESGRRLLTSGYVLMGWNDSMASGKQRGKRKPWRDGFVGLQDPDRPYVILSTHPKTPKSIAMKP